MTIKERINYLNNYNFVGIGLGSFMIFLFIFILYELLFNNVIIFLNHFIVIIFFLIIFYLIKKIIPHFRKQKTESIEWRRGLPVWIGWVGFVLAALIILFLSSVAGGSLSWRGHDGAGFGFIIIFLLNVPLILGLILFFCSKIKKKIKIISFIVCLVLFFRIACGIYGLPSPFEPFFGIHAKVIEKLAIEFKNPESCLGAGDLFPFSNFTYGALVEANKIAPLQKDCIETVALDKKDESFCDILTSEKMAYPPYGSGYKNDCYIEVAKIKKDTSICEDLEKGVIPDKALCYQGIFLLLEKYNDALIDCKEINSKSYLGSLDDCFMNAAIKINDLELCKGIWSPNESAECRKEIQIAISDSDDALAPCKEFLTTETKNECIKNIAIEQDDIDLCSLFGSSESGIAAECYKGIIFSGRRSDVALCKEQFPDPKGFPQRTCLFEVAVNKNDISICKRGGSYSSTAWCYTGIAIKRNDLQVCYKLIDDYMHVPEEDCFIDLAFNTDNPEICKELKYEYQREGCVGRIIKQRNIKE